MNIPLCIINQVVCFVFDIVSTAIRITADMLNTIGSIFLNSFSIGPAQTVAQQAIKMSQISSHSVTAWSNCLSKYLVEPHVWPKLLFLFTSCRRLY